MYLEKLSFVVSKPPVKEREGIKCGGPGNVVSITSKVSCDVKGQCISQFPSSGEVQRIIQQLSSIHRMDLFVVIVEARDDTFPAFRVIVYPVVAFKEKLMFKSNRESPIHLH
jgi:hypothetical protein